MKPLHGSYLDLWAEPTEEICISEYRVNNPGVFIQLIFRGTSYPEALAVAEQYVARGYGLNDEVGGATAASFVNGGRA